MRPVAEVRVPGAREGFPPDWVTAALAASHPGLIVSDVEVTEVDAGTTTRVRLGLCYRAGAGPKSVFVKIQGRLDHRVFLGALGVLYRESRLSAIPVPVERPLVYATGIDRRRLQSVVVFEDLLLRGGEPNDATRPIPPAVVADGLRQLARFHAACWGPDAVSRPDFAWIPPLRFTPGWAAVSLAGTTRALRKMPEVSEPVPTQLKSGRRLTALWRDALAVNGLGEPTIVHGDAHVGNTYSLPGGRVGFLDWQVSRRGSWPHDVGYFMTSALSVEDRRTHERELLQTYLDALSGQGVRPPDWDEAWLRYRRTPAHGLPVWMTTAGLGDYQRDDIARETVRRFATAYVDLETGDALASANLRRR